MNEKWEFKGPKNGGRCGVVCIDNDPVITIAPPFKKNPGAVENVGRKIEAIPDLRAAVAEGLFIARAYRAMCLRHAGGLPAGLLVSISNMEQVLNKTENQ